MRKAPFPVDPLTQRGPYILLLAMLISVGAMATSLYTPSLPAIGAALQASPAQVQLTLSLYLMGYACAQLLYGPLSDRFGRRPVIAVGLLIFLAGSALCLLAPNIEVLIGGRFVQALGASSTVVVSRAVARDTFNGPELIRAMTAVMLVFSMVPALAPLIGGFLEEWLGWRSAFGFMLLLAATWLVLFGLFMDESLRRPLARLDLRVLVDSYRTVARSLRFVIYTVTTGLVFAGLFAYVGGAPGVFIDVLQVSPARYGFYPLLTAGGFMLGALIVRRLSGRVADRRIILSALLLMFTSGTLMLMLPHTILFRPLLIALTATLYVTGVSMFAPTASTNALMDFPQLAGTASALLGFGQMLSAAVGTAVLGMLQHFTRVYAFPLVMWMCGAGALLLYYQTLYGRRPD